MPLESYIPQIDDRRFDDIMTEVRTRIARYAPEWTPVWTDVNDNDPGIAMTQVVAWLVEMLMHRMSQVPPLNYLKFLQLIGIELNPAEPAQGEITFPIKASHPERVVLIPERTQLSAEPSDEGPPLVFETTRGAVVIRATLDAVQAFDGFSYSNVSGENVDARQGFYPFGQFVGDDCALLLGFNDAEPFPEEIELNLTCWVADSYAPTTAFQCGLPATSMWGPAKLIWEHWNGTEWRSMSLLRDETYALTRSGHIYLKTPPKDSLQKTKLGAVTDVPLYWVRGRVTQSQYERAPKLLAVRTNTVAVEQAETIRDEVLGGSNGRRDQIFKLANSPVIKESLRLEVYEGSGYEVWTRKDDFFGSGPGDHHYILNRTSGELRFGDGINGSIPVANIDNPTASIVARVYRVGGGKRGNVPAKTIKTLLTTVEGVDDNGVENLMAAHSGRDEETLEAAKRRAPHLLKSRCRAVTAEDFELLAMQASSIKRAKALPLFHPSFPDVKVPGVVTVIVVPEADAVTPNPLPSEGTLRTVCAYLDMRRLLTTELYVVKPNYQRVAVRADILVQDQADLAEVKPAIEKALQQYFHPLTGGEDGFGWPFGGTIYFSRVYQRVFTVSGVQSITRLAIFLDGTEAPECQDVPIKEHTLTYSTEHEINVGYRFD